MRILPTEAGEFLEESWQILVIATADNVAHISNTLSDIAENSYSTNVSVVACDEPTVRQALADFACEVHFILPAELEPEKCWATVVAQFEFHSPRTILLFAGTRVPDAWDARLAAAGQRCPQAATVSPLSCTHPIFSVFAHGEHAPTLDVNDVDQWLSDYAGGTSFSVPVFSPGCLLLQGDIWLQEKPVLESDTELLNLLRGRGLWQIATDQLYVDDSVGAPAVSMSSIPQAAFTAFEQRHPLARIRHALSELCARGEQPSVQRKTLPVQLHVGHSWGGGLNRWVADYLDADDSHNHLVLRSIGDRSAFGQQIALYLGADMGIPLRTWQLAQPIQSTVVSQMEYVSLLEQIVTEFGVESLVVSSLIGHSLDVLRTGLSTTLVLHDFFPFCPALYACFSSPCQTCGNQELRQCGLENPLHSYFKQESAEHWLAIRDAFLERVENPALAVVAPSQSVVDRYAVLEPRMRDKTISVVAHGLSSNLSEQFIALRSSLNKSASGRLKVLILGRITADKGGDLLAAMMPELAKFADVHLLGAGENGEQFREMPSCTVVPQYSMESLQEHLKDIDPDMGLLLSVVPETFSYTLSELWAVGIPVMATRSGAFADRIQDRENGWLESTDPVLLTSRLKSIDDDREQLSRVRAQVMKQPVLTAKEMVADYRKIHPSNSGVLLSRFYLSRRSYQNPYQQVSEQDQTLLYLQRTQGVEATYRGVLREFLQYSGQKIDKTERVPVFLRSLLRRTLNAFVRLL